MSGPLHPADDADRPTSAKRRQTVGLVTVQEGRIVAPSTDRVRLWTIIKPLAWERLQAAGELAADPDLAQICWHWPEAYAWMRGQMARRIAGYGGGALWWAWAMPKPDLRKTANHELPTGGVMYRLTLDVPVDEVLLNDFDGWHNVLNDGYIGEPISDQARADMEAVWELIFDYVEPPPPSAVQRVAAVESYWSAVAPGLNLPPD